MGPLSCLASFNEHNVFEHNVFIHLVARASTSFHFMPKWYSITWRHNILFMHLSVDEHLGHFHPLTGVNIAAMNIPLYIFVWIPAFNHFVYILSAEPAAVPFCMATSNVWEFQFLHVRPNTCYFPLRKKNFFYDQPSGYETVSHCGFDLHYPDD